VIKNRGISITIRKKSDGRYYLLKTRTFRISGELGEREKFKLAAAVHTRKKYILNC